MELDMASCQRKLKNKKMNLIKRLITKITGKQFAISGVSSSALELHKYTSKLYVECGTLLLKNGFKQTGKYVFTRQNKDWYDKRIFCLYHFYTDGLTLNIYYPSESSILIKNTQDLQKQIDRFKHEL